MTANRPSKVSDEQLLAALAHADNLHQLLLALGIAGYGGNYDVIRARLAALGVDDPRFSRGSRRITWPEVSAEELRRAVAASDGYASVARLVGLGDSAAAQRRAKSLIIRAGLDTGHFRGQGWKRGAGLVGGTVAEPLTSVLVQGRRVSTSKLRVRLINEGFLLPECAACARTQWEGGPIPLELDHVNGDRLDNRLENLRLLCPNCHATTDTYRGRNIGAPRSPAPVLSEAGETPVERARRRLTLLLSAPLVVP